MKTIACIFVVYGIFAFAACHEMAQGVKNFRVQFYAIGIAIMLCLMWLARETWRGSK